VLCEKPAAKENPVLFINALKNSRRNHQLALAATASLALVIAYFTLTPVPKFFFSGGDKL